MAKKRNARSASGPSVSSNPFADALANALGVEAPQSAERIVWNEEEEAVEGSSTKWVHIGFEKERGEVERPLPSGFPKCGRRPFRLGQKVKDSPRGGGSVDPEGIVLQGDVRTKAEAFLQAEGFKTKTNRRLMHIESTQNPKFKTMLRWREKSSARRKGGICLVEGLREVERALDSDGPPSSLCIVTG